MRIGALRVELQFPASRSLKEKRRCLKSLVAKLQNRFNCSVSEVDYQDLHQRAAIGIAIVAPDGSFAAKVLNPIREYVEMNPEGVVLDIQELLLDGPDAFERFRDI